MRTTDYSALDHCSISYQSGQQSSFDHLVTFAEIERLIGKIYFRFSHLFLHHPTLRDFWWEMGMEREQHACNLSVMSAVVNNDSSPDNPSVSREKTDQLKQTLTSYLRRGTPAITPKEALRIARKIEACEIDVIYSDLLDAGCFPAAKETDHRLASGNSY